LKTLGLKQPTSPSWWGQYHHENGITKKNINSWNLTDSLGGKASNEDKYDLFLLILADHLAASSTRIYRSGGQPDPDRKGIVKLWNDKFYESQGEHWAAFRNKEDLKKVFEEIDCCSSGEEFLERYKKHLLLTPEDKAFPINVTSLYTHCELVGKFYRVLKKYTKLVNEPNGELSIEYNGTKVKEIKEAEGRNEIKGKWKARMVKCWIKFPHSFVRLRDINLLRKREELIKKLKEKYPDNVIFHTSDFIFLFLTLEDDLKEIFKEFLEYGFYIETVEILSDLGLLESILDIKVLEARSGKNKSQERLENFNKRDVKVYKNYLMPEMPEEISPPICDICQQRQGEERIKENIKEWICSKCNDIRKEGKPFKEYAEEWEKDGIKVCWFKISLDQKKLENWLKKGFERYYKKNKDRVIEDIKNKIEDIKNEIEDIKNKKERLLSEKSTKDKDIEKSKKEINELKKSIKKLEGEINGLEKSIENIEYIGKNLDSIRYLALQIDFNRDYKKALNEFWEEFKERKQSLKDIKQPIPKYDELGVFKYTPELALEVVKNFIKVFEKYFPDCISDEDCPISLSLSMANIKYPIREHWRFFEKSEKKFLNIKYQNVFEENYTKKELDMIIKNIINDPPTSFLNKLSFFERRYESDIYISIEIFNNRENYPQIYELFSNEIKPSKFLNLYRLLGKEENV